MKLKNHYLLVLIIFVNFLISSCSSPVENEPVYFISYDDISGFVSLPTIVSSTLAHSGLKCVQINPDNIYGPNFSSKLENISTHEIKKIHIKAFVRLDTPSSVAKLVCSVDDETGNTVYWNAVDTKSSKLTSGNWELLEGTFEITGKNKKNYKINIYPLFSLGGNILIDDLQIKFE